MPRGWLLLTLFFLACVTACRAAPNNRGIGSRPRPTAPVLVVSARDTTFVPLADLAAAPSLYEGRFIEVSGQYQARPLLICADEPRLSPATWQLVSGDNAIMAGGFDSVLRPFAAADPPLTLTVQGRWLRWQGPVGCGKRALRQDFWYLAVREIIAPNPIVRTADQAGAVGGGVPATAVSQLSPTPTPPAILPTPTTVATLAATLPPAPLDTPPVPSTATATASLTIEATATATGSVTGTPTGTPGPSPTASATGTPGPSPTRDPTQATPTNTPVSAVNQGMILPQGVSKGSFTGSETHRWQFSLLGTDVITVSVAPALNRDVSFTVHDSAGNLLASQDTAGTGQVETLPGLSLAMGGTYDVLVRFASGQPGNYAILINTSDSYVFQFERTLAYGDELSSEMRAEVDVFWNFDGVTGDIITIRLAPDASANGFIELFDPDMDLVAQRMASTGNGVVRELLNYRLAKTGMYSIHIGEFNYLPMRYTVTLVKSGP